MAVGMFKLSHKERNTLSYIFIILNVVQIILGAGMTGSSLYICIAVSPVLLTERAEVSFVFAVTGIYGTNVIFHWIIGIRMCRKCFHQAHKKSTSNLLLLWYCAGTNTVVILIIISHYARKNGKHIVKSMKQSISSGMTNYLADLSWKETIDRLQYTNECCGVTSYEDWHVINWLSKYHVDVKSETVKQFRTSQEVLDLPVTPWSCCRVDFPMQCLHDPLQQAQYAHIWVDEPTVIKDSINTKGCLDGLKRPILIVINLFIFLTSMVFIIHVMYTKLRLDLPGGNEILPEDDDVDVNFQVMTFIISRILYTSSRNAILLNDPEGIAPGWVFGRGDCGYAGGKTLAEIMEMPQRQASLLQRQEALERPKKPKDENVNKNLKKKFGEYIPKRFRRNKEVSKLDESDDKGINEGSNMLEEGSLEFEPKIHSTMRKAHRNKDESEVDNTTEAFSMEREFSKRSVVGKSRQTRNDTEDAHDLSMEGELRRLQQ